MDMAATLALIKLKCINMEPLAQGHVTINQYRLEVGFILFALHRSTL